jgi:hypothetical protein
VRRLPSATLLLVVMLVTYSLRFSRGTGILCLAFPLLGWQAMDALRRLPRLEAWLEGRVWRSVTRAAPWLVGAALVAATAVLLVRDMPLRVGVSTDPRYEPVGAAEFMLEHRPQGVMYNEIGDGGYLLWRLRPLYPVFLDGRNEVYAELLPDWSQAQDRPHAWARFLAHHEVDTAVLRYTFTPAYPPAEAHDSHPVTFARAFFPRSSWALVYWDDHNMVYLRRIPGHRELIADLEFTCLHPEDFANTMPRLAEDPAFATCVTSELARRLRSEPPSELALQWARRLASHRQPPPEDG